MKERNKEYTSEGRNQGTSKGKHGQCKKRNLRIKFNEEKSEERKIECFSDSVEEKRDKKARYL